MSESMRQMSLRLGIPFSTLKRKLQRTGEYKPDQGRKGLLRNPRYPIEDYLEGRRFLGAHKLKLRLIRENIKPSHCEICGISEWLGERVPLELDHIDRNNKNNTLSNLQILCPICHAIKTRKDRQYKK